LDIYVRNRLTGEVRSFDRGLPREAAALAALLREPDPRNTLRSAWEQFYKPDPANW
jgi:hypothetical protein